MSFDIIDYKIIDTSNIIYETPQKIKGGSYMSEVKYNNNGNIIPFIIQTPKLVCTEGIIKNNVRTVLDLEFDKTHTQFYDFILDIDDNNILQTEKNSEKWFNQKFPLDIVEEFYKSPVGLGRGKNPPKLKFKIPNNLEYSIVNKNKNKLEYTEVKKGEKIVSVIKLLGLRFLRQQVICEWVPLQLLVDKEKTEDKCNFIIDESLLSDNEEEAVDKIIDIVSDNENDDEVILENEENTSKETLVEENPVEEENKVEETLVEENPVQETLVEENPVEETLEENPVEENIENIGSIENYKELYEKSLEEIKILTENLQKLEIENNNNLEIIEKFKSLLTN